MYISWILKSSLLSGFLSVQLPSCEDGQVVWTRIEHATVSWRFLIFGWDSRWVYCLNDSTPINGLKRLVNWGEKKNLPYRSSFTPIYTVFWSHLVDEFSSSRSRKWTDTFFGDWGDQEGTCQNNCLFLFFLEFIVVKALVFTISTGAVFFTSTSLTGLSYVSEITLFMTLKKNTSSCLWPLLPVVSWY